MANPLRRSALPIADADLDQFEAESAVALPPDYRAFLLANNGGVPQGNRFRYTLTTGKSRRAVLKAFFPLTPYGWVEAGIPTIGIAREQLCGGWPPGYLAIGRAETDVNSGLLCLGVSDGNAGQVSFRPDGDKATTFYDVAKSLAELLDGMKPENPPEKWHPLVEAGDAEGFRAWCGVRSKLLRRDAADRNSFVGKCVEENQPALLDVLLADFPDVFTAAGIVEESLGVHRLDLALRFLPAAKGDLRDDLLNRPGPFFWHAPVLVEAMIDAGIDPCDESFDGNTPLHEAVRAAATVQSLELLLARGADPTHANDAGDTPLALAEKIERPEIAATLRAAIARWREAHPAPDPDAVTPFDLCGITFTRTGKPITTVEVAATEAKLKLSFPPEYRWLLTQVNGGVPSQAQMPEELFPEVYFADDDEEEDEDESDGGRAEVQLTLIPLRQVDCVPKATSDESEEGYALNYPVEEAIGWYHDGSEMPRGVVPIASLSDYGYGGASLILLSCKGPRRGQLFAMDHHPEPLNLTLPELFARLAQAATRPAAPGNLLADAVEVRDLDGVRAALALCEGKVTAARDGRQPLDSAARAGFDDALALMADAVGADDVLFKAVEHGRLEFAEAQLLAGVRLKKQTVAALFYCDNLYRDLDLLHAAIARGAKLDKLLADKDGSILLPATRSRNVAALEYLLSQGGDVQYVSYQSGSTLLHAAVFSPRREGDPDPLPMAAFLLSRGVPAHQGDANALTALHHAIDAGHRAVAEALIDAGASMTVAVAHDSPHLHSPEMQQEAIRTQKEFAKFLKQFGQPQADDLADEDALDLDDPANRQVSETMGLVSGMSNAMAGMVEKLKAKFETPPAERLGQSAFGMYAARPACKDLVEHLIAYEAARK